MKKYITNVVKDVNWPTACRENVFIRENVGKYLNLHDGLLT